VWAVRRLGRRNGHLGRHRPGQRGQISPAHRPAGYEAFATFHPTFLYELIWNLVLAAFLVWLVHHRRIKPLGLFALYVAGYSAFRIFEESLRVDPAHHILGLRLNFYVATVLCLAGLLWLARSQAWQPGWRWPRRGTALMLAGGIVVMSGCGVADDARANASVSGWSQPPPSALVFPWRKSRSQNRSLRMPALDDNRAPWRR
jgi:Prolipoprotein diacylglyceryl transferase